MKRLVMGLGLSAMLAVACVGDIGNAPTGGVGTPASTSTGEQCIPDITSNASVMEGLRDQCAGCHQQGSNKPFFSSVAAFEALLVYNPVYITPGDPASSYLITLLKGQGQGAFKQMPTAGPTFSDLADGGSTSLTMAQLEAWITDLPEPNGLNFDALRASTVRRMTAEQLLEQFNTPLTLADDDLFNANGEASDGSLLPARSADAINVVRNYINEQAQVYPRFLALGGPHHLERRLRSKDVSPTLLQSMVQMSQARCRLAVENNSPEFFRHADIKTNIGYLYLRILGEVATAADVDELYEQVFQIYEPGGVDVAWTATCAALARHPLAMVY